MREIAGLVVALIVGGMLCLAQAQNMSLMGAGGFAPGATFAGPADLSGLSTWLMWGSCARVLKASLASTGTSLCDLVATGNGATVCTLRGSSSGKVDLAASYCSSTTPSAACAAANGGSCSVTKVYDQTTNGNHLIQATLAKMPLLTFSAINSLPCMTFAQSSSQTLATSGSIAQSQPFTVSTVAQHSDTTNGVTFQSGGAATVVDFFSSTAVTYTSFAGGTNQSATYTGASAFHAIQHVFDDSNSKSAFYIDGTSTAANGAGTDALASNFNIGSNGSIFLNGDICEIGAIALSATSAEQTSLNGNQHGTNGYNF